MLSATADSQTNDIRFDNTYTPTPVDVTVKADKHLIGRALNDGEFTAELKDMDGNTLQSKRFKRTTGSEAKADEGDGTLTFDKLTFDKTGIYKYTVDETDTQLGGVTYDTTRPQLEKLMADLDAMLKASPDTYEDTAFVRMTGFGDSSINLMVSAYLRTADLGVFLRMQNDLNLNIMDVMKADGVDFAFPSTTVYLAKEN